ncbi:hypothetical protein GBO17_20480 [Mycobacterium avium subsp. hominissuis]|nr:hypothetical protein [Mycobacterium avium subsp. hominissuis]MBZ4570841.1 hypothetical protein [Mycobacterium avium subsp. hominissuis]MBZ4588255.1 hypothetical protein [Mycobacterium avium subsp. hominissuis]MBZ4626969.1 hypothetical protein [Mycobacterium avium subsp. hominissuis]
MCHDVGHGRSVLLSRPVSGRRSLASSAVATPLAQIPGTQGIGLDEFYRYAPALSTPGPRLSSPRAFSPRRRESAGQGSW